MNLPTSLMRGVLWFGLLVSFGRPSNANQIAGPTVSDSYDTQNVVILSICGIRNLETFRNPDATPTYHPFMPGIWTQLVPLGTLYSQFYNLKDTWTTPSHHSILTGVWQSGPNKKYIGLDTDTRSMQPTIFEAYRKACGAPASDTWAVVGGVNLINMNYSLHPLFGMEYEALVERAPPHPDPEINNDGETYLSLIEKLQQDRPRLALSVLKGVDYTAHAGTWDDYVQTLLWVDQVTVDLWNWLQGDSFYADQTTLIVLSDHGRHDIGEGNPDFALNWTDHGGTCYGCRDCFLFVLGPDTPAGQVVTDVRYQTDVAPTVAELLGFDMPHCEGQVLDEALGRTIDRPPSERSPDLAVSDGICHLVCQIQQDGSSQIWYRRSDDGGQTYSVEHQLSSQTVWAERPRILVDELNGDLVVMVAWIDFKDLDAANISTSPRVYLRRSVDGGQSFLPEQEILSRPFESANAQTRVEGGQRISDLSIAKLNEGHALAVAVQKGYIHFVYSDDGFTSSFYSYEIDDSWADPTREGSYPQDICLAPLSAPSHYAACWADISWESEPLALNYEIGMKRGNAALATFDAVATRLTTSSSHTMGPSLASDRTGRLYLAYADRRGGSWQIFLQSSCDDGATWSQPPIRVTASAKGAWEPSVVALETSALVAYSDLSAGSGDIFVRWFDGTIWRGPHNISPTPEISRRPILSRDELGELFVAWEEELPGGGWETHLAPVTKMEGLMKEQKFSAQE